MDNVIYNSKLDWKLNEIVYPADSNRWEKGIADVVALANYLNTTDIPQLRTQISNITNTTANKDLSNLSATGKAVINGKVSKTGDTMTGYLLITRTMDHVVAADTNLSINTIPSENNIYGGFYTIKDKDNEYFGRLFAANMSSGYNQLAIQVRSNRTANRTASIGVSVKQDGTSAAGFAPTPASASNGTDIATTAWVRSYVTSILPSSLSTQIAPDYAHGQSVTIGADFVPPSNGWLYILAATYSNDSVKLYVDGAEISASISNKGDPGIIRTLVPIYITSGHTYKVTMTQNRDASWNKCYFYPIMGV